MCTTGTSPNSTQTVTSADLAEQVLCAFGNKMREFFVQVAIHDKRLHKDYSLPHSPGGIYVSDKKKITL